mmetsp:Transcript_19705/g.59670  ORF Transcript_19705/g.59670 Transcript_19705/m.59670 type:complete len:334 (+) Transcript_19705:950-1951(+)
MAPCLARRDLGALGFPGALLFTLTPNDRRGAERGSDPKGVVLHASIAHDARGATHAPMIPRFRHCRALHRTRRRAHVQRSLVAVLPVELLLVHVPFMRLEVLEVLLVEEGVALVMPLLPVGDLLPLHGATCGVGRTRTLMSPFRCLSIMHLGHLLAVRVAPGPAAGVVADARPRLLGLTRLPHRLRRVLLIGLVDGIRGEVAAHAPFGRHVHAILARAAEVDEPLHALLRNLPLSCVLEAQRRLHGDRSAAQAVRPDVPVCGGARPPMVRAPLQAPVCGRYGSRRVRGHGVGVGDRAETSNARAAFASSVLGRERQPVAARVRLGVPWDLHAP